MGKPPGREVVRFLSRVQTGRGCWLWRGQVGPNGYGYLGRSLAHRRSYELLVGPIPKGLELDHLCRTPACVNPDHLDPVTHAENVYRGTSMAAENRVKEVCKNGHAFDLENTYYRKNGQRDCRRCKADRERARQARLRAERR